VPVSGAAPAEQLQSIAVKPSRIARRKRFRGERMRLILRSTVTERPPNAAVSSIERRGEFPCDALV
jgi:hypothetical protein